MFMNITIKSFYTRSNDDLYSCYNKIAVSKIYELTSKINIKNGSKKVTIRKRSPAILSHMNGKSYVKGLPSMKIKKLI